MATSSTGNTLERIRRHKGVSLDEIAASTKISPIFLRAIESEEFGKLPGGVFNSNYLRQYAQAVGIDPAELMDRYTEWQAEQEQKLQPKPEPQRRPAAIRWLASFMASLLPLAPPNS